MAASATAVLSCRMSMFENAAPSSDGAVSLARAGFFCLVICRRNQKTSQLFKVGWFCLWKCKVQYYANHSGKKKGDAQIHKQGTIQLGIADVIFGIRIKAQFDLLVGL